MSILVEVIEVNGDLVIPLPDEILETLKWKQDDLVTWLDNKDGSFTISKVD